MLKTRLGGRRLDWPGLILELIWLRIGTSSGILWNCQWTFWFQKMRGIFD